MDQSFADFDFQSFPDEIRSKPKVTTITAARPRPRNKPVTSLSSTFYVCGPQDKTAKRLGELQTAMPTVGGIVELTTRATSDSDLEEIIEGVRTMAVGLVSGTHGVDIGDNHRQHKCPLKLSCTRCWRGDHGASHTTANWLICSLLKSVYTTADRDIAASDDETADDAWNIDEEDEHGSYRYIPHEKQDYCIEAGPRRKIDRQKLLNLFRITIPQFFAGLTHMPRIGAIHHPTFKGVKVPEDRVWCKKPYCTRTLLAPGLVDSKGRPACGKFHSDESSFLTSVLRVLVECKSVARQETPRQEEVVKPPRAPRPPKVKVTVAPAPVVARNAFSALDDDDSEGKDENGEDGEKNEKKTTDAW